MFFGKEEDKPNRTIQVKLSFGEQHLYFIGLRLGYLHLLSAKGVQEELEKMGPEVLDPDFTVDAFNLAEKYRVPVMVMSDEIVGHMREKISIPEKVNITTRQMPTQGPEDFLPYHAEPDGTSPMPAFGDGYKMHITGLTHDERGYPDASNPKTHAQLVKRLCDKILHHTDEIARIQSENVDDAEVIVLSYGAPSRSALKAVRTARKEGLKAGFVKLDVVWPLPEKMIREAVGEAQRVIVVEMNLGQIFYEIQRILPQDVELASKIGGEMHLPEEILKVIKSGSS